MHMDQWSKISTVYTKKLDIYEQYPSKKDQIVSVFSLFHRIFSADSKACSVKELTKNMVKIVRYIYIYMYICIV